MPRLLREGDGRVTTIELFFDLVYVFAITQLSHLLVDHRTLDGAVQTAVLLAMVWQIWVYTTWMTNYLDPNRQVLRLVLVASMLASLVLAAALPSAFGSRGWLVAGIYVGVQVVRSLIVVWLLRGEALQLTFWRAVTWSAAAGVPMLFGAAVDGHAREALWAAAVLVELGGSLAGFPTPGLGRSETAEWTIDGGHFAERCQAFVLIALGESIVVTGTTVSGLLDSHHPNTERFVAFLVAFAGAVALWWVYFDRAAEDSARVIAASDDPGRLGRNAFHLVHPLIIAGIIVSAAADEVVLDDPSRHGVRSTSWLVVGGVALFLAGHAVFKAIVWRLVSWPRVIAVLVLLALLALAPHVSALVLGVATLAVVIAMIVADRLQHADLLEHADA